jgi:hypothetical protein
MYVLLKHEPFNPIKPYHIESLKRFEESSPKNPKFKLYGIYNSELYAYRAMVKEVMANLP